MYVRAVFLCLMGMFLSVPISVSAQSTVHREHIFTTKDVVSALMRAYPEIVKEVPDKLNKHKFLPSVMVGEIPFYNIEGRLLPDSHVKKWEKYGPCIFYEYTKDIPNPAFRSKEEIEKLKEMSTDEALAKPLAPLPAFEDRLYRISNKKEAMAILVESTFFGQKILFHPLAVEALKNVELEIKALAEKNSKISDYVKSIDTIKAFEWRSIKKSKRRSFHAYGVAIDLYDSSVKDKPRYWLSRCNQGHLDWMVESVSIRWSHPEAVVKIFEKYGFTWGGKWHFYDTEYFAYRPEILLLNGFNI